MRRRAGLLEVALTSTLLVSGQGFLVLPTCRRSSGSTGRPPAGTETRATGASEPHAQQEVDCGSITRPAFVRSGVSMATTALIGCGFLSPDECRAEVVIDDTLGFKFETPEGWERGDAQISGRRKIVVFTSPKNPGANAFVAYTPVRGDFTTLGSFGTLDEVSRTVLPEAQGVKSSLVDSYSSKNAYVYDYIVDQEGRPEKHIKTMWLLFPAEGQLATITAQCNEADYPDLGKEIDKIIASVAKT